MGTVTMHADSRRDLVVRVPLGRRCQFGTFGIACAFAGDNLLACQRLRIPYVDWPGKCDQFEHEGSADGRQTRERGLDARMSHLRKCTRRAPSISAA